MRIKCCPICNWKLKYNKSEKLNYCNRECFVLPSGNFEYHFESNLLFEMAITMPYKIVSRKIVSDNDNLTSIIYKLKPKSDKNTSYDWIGIIKSPYIHLDSKDKLIQRIKRLILLS